MVQRRVIVLINLLSILIRKRKKVIPETGYITQMSAYLSECAVIVLTLVNSSVKYIGKP